MEWAFLLELTGVCTGFDVVTSSRKRAEKRCTSYPEGLGDTVYYNPIYIIAAAFGFFGLGFVAEMILL